MRKSFSVLLAALLASAACVSSSALTLDTAETAAENANPAPVLAEAPTPDIPLYSAEYGNLIYYQDMEVASDSADYKAALASNVWVDSDYVSGVSYSIEGGSVSYAVDPTDSTNSVAYANGNSGSFIQFVSNLSLPLEEGKYTVLYDYYIPSKRADGTDNPGVGFHNTRWFTTVFPKNAEGTSVDKDKISKKLSKTDRDTWLTDALTTVSLKKDGGGYTFGVENATQWNYDAQPQTQQLRFIIKDAVYYLDNIRVYYMSADTFFIKVGANATAVTPKGDTYTFPEISEAAPDYTGKFYGWLGGGKIYQPGQTVNVSELGAKTFVPMEVPLFSESYGDLVAFYNYETGVAPSYTNAEYTSSTAAFSGSNGIGNIREKTLADGNTVGEAYPYSNHENADYAFAAANVTSSVPAQYTVSAGIMLPEDVERSQFTDTVWLRVSVPGIDTDRFHGADLSKINSSTLTYGYSQYAGNSLNGIGINFTRVKGTLNSYYFDNYAVYAFPTNKVVYKTAENTYAKYDLSGDTYTFPQPSDIGISTENFFAWTNGTNTFKPGQTVAVSEVRYKIISAFNQSADVPAMGYVFDNNLKNAGTYTELIEDEGRDVLHLHQYKIFNNQLKTWSHDVRISMYGADTAFDPKEYPIVQYMYKITKATSVPTEHKANKEYDPATDGAPVAIEAPEFAFWYATPKSGSTTEYWIANNGEQKITGGNIKLNADGKYHQLTYNMRNTASNSKVPFMDAEKIGGFALDPCTTNWENDVYIDYIRVYRSGITTVTYDTNAPAGAAVIKNVSPDTNRGLGTGYLLTGERPEVEGYVFLGWSETKDGTKTVDSIHLKGDTTVYAVWKEASKFGSAEADGKVEIKNMGSGVSAIRFSSTISNTVKANMDELGFIVTREALLPKNSTNEADLTALTHQLKKTDENVNLYVEGVAYDKDTDTDLARGQDEDTADWIYTALCTGIPTDKADESIVIRSYAKYFINGKAVTLYGTPAKNSVKAIAQAIYDAEDKTTYNANKEYIDGILGN